MKNGEYESKYQKEIIKQLKFINALLRDHTDHMISVRAALEVIMVYLPACASGEEPSKATVMRLCKAYEVADKRIRRRTRKALRNLA